MRAEFADNEQVLRCISPLKTRVAETKRELLLQKRQTLQEEIQSDVAEPVVDALKVEAAYRKSQPVEVAEPEEEEAGIQFDSDPEIEQELQAILALKQAGDGQWVTRLESFRKQHPDYPLPDALVGQVP